MALKGTLLNADNINVDIQPVCVVGNQSEVTTSTASIAATASLTGSIDLEDKELMALTVSAWTAAAITFQVSTDNVTFVDLYNKDGEVTIPSASVGTGRAIALNSILGRFRYVKIRSGVSATPVAQVGAVTVTLIKSAG